MNLSPSLMCADPGHYAEEIAFLQAAGADSFHLDVMDGEFVPNFALSWADIEKFRTLTDLPLEVHLMVRNLDLHINFARKANVDLVYVHSEHSKAAEALRRIRELGMRAGLAFNPETPVESVRPFAGLFDALLLMRVRPGFAGQTAIEAADSKAVILSELFPNIPIVADGAVSPIVCESLAKKKVSGFVLGTSSLFGKEKPYRIILHDLKKSIF